MIDDPELRELDRQARAALEVARALEAKKAAREKKLAAERLEPLRDLAVYAHDSLCSYNHTDGCGWCYEARDGVHNWEADAHYRWLQRVDELVNGTSTYGSHPRVMHPVSLQTLREILDAVVALKAKHRDVLWMLRHGLEPR